MNERELFIAALEKTPQERAEFLRLACADDPPLAQRVEALLQSHERAGDFLQKPLVDRLIDGVARMEDPAQTACESAAVHPPLELGFLRPSNRQGSLSRLEHYEIQDVIGSGGMGIVLRAFDENLHRVVAIKVMAASLAANATARKQFKREAQAAAAVSHDHIVTIHAVDDAGERPYLVMQYVAGLSLQQRLDRDGPLDLQEILRIGMQTASALSAAHAQGLIHRDIKPANILLENGVERVKITDFGLARAASEVSATQSGVIAGTPQYMSPEQAEGKAVDQRTDLFSLGSVLYAMCTGRAPFRASGTMAVLKRVCEQSAASIRESNSEIPEWLVAVIDKLHAKDPAERFGRGSCHVARRAPGERTATGCSRADVPLAGRSQASERIVFAPGALGDRRCSRVTAVLPWRPVPLRSNRRHEATGHGDPHLHAGWDARRGGE